MRVLGKVLLLLAGAVVALVQLVVAMYVGNGVYRSIEVHHAAAQARADVAAGLPAARQQAEEWQRQAARFGAPAYFWDELDCDFDSVDAGWLVDHYQQACVVRSVAMWPRDQVPVECRDADEGVLAPTRLLEDPDAWQCPRWLTEPSGYGAHRLLDGSRPKGLGSSPAWLVALHQVEVSRTDLGCDPWGVIFCGVPMDRPAI